MNSTNFQQYQDAYKQIQRHFQAIAKLSDQLAQRVYLDLSASDFKIPKAEFRTLFDIWKRSQHHT